MALKYLWSYARQVVKLNGLPMVGGHFEVFIHNTTTKYITKADFDGTDNPFKVYLDSRGMALMLADDSQTYDIYCYDEFNSLYWSRYGVSADDEFSDVKFIPKGTASVAYLNGTISGLAVGWVYTLTDSGTLLAGNIEVEVGDEVAWYGSAWYKVGAESKTKIFNVVYDNDNSVWTWPSYTEVLNAWLSGKVPVLKMTNPAGAKTLFTMQEATAAASPNYFIFISWERETISTESSKKVVVKINSDNTTDVSSSYENSNKNIATNYDDLTFPVAEGTFCEHLGLMYYCSVLGGIATIETWTAAHWTQTSVAEQIGNVEALLAAL